MNIMASPIRTKEQLNKRLDKVRSLADEGDDEKAHVEQDKLLRDVLVGITSGANDPVYLSGKSLEVFNIEFSRWYS
ncbi:hypothetical protein Pryu01_03049 [Paraliobacillus ryukyuensis]|uniref:Uncharacterized protein n=1 Tax=Paraliobacillus ryukyuensis TaxID=200904 RepID=A0A366DQC6_9BACI|nr:hypothetical protein [Paraliobacillus ryukyuensis]RBO92280.1 hypothetical protein DES48_11518 [Paraliobacillus ryukyuensis]